MFRNEKIIKAAPTQFEIHDDIDLIAKIKTHWQSLPKIAKDANDI